MRQFIGIDLGTTNSAICSYDGQNVRVWKSPDQNDVTPSAIYIDKRGNRYYGQRAYDNAPRNPNNSATLFKRFMGTSTKVEIKGAGITLTPEECSAEILKVLFGYLPEEIREAEDTAVVITVPAAFNQMKKDATLEAARLAGFRNVALMQEPVAAVMSVMRQTRTEGIFLIYDLGGGTFDVSIAENIGGKVNLLAHGGIEMCGGRDWDRAIFNSIIVPWLRDHFRLPEDLLANSHYKSLISLAQWAAEKAKIELSSKEETIISLSESEARCMDLDGEEIYIDIPINRDQLDGYIAKMISETVSATRETMQKAGLTANDIERIVFVGGPTNYKPLRDAVCRELALPTDININPMTAVAEGASIFAESINWEDNKHGRKASNAEVRSDCEISFRYTARTPYDFAKVVFITKDTQGFSAEIRSLDTGWTSGRMSLANGSTIELPLQKAGDNSFEVSVFDTYGRPMKLEESRIVITKTIATIGAIPASQSIGVEVMSTLGGSTGLDFLVREGDDLPKKGVKTFKAGQTVKAGSSSALNIKLWEGSIESPVEDNRFIGVLKISGTDFESGVISTGAEIVCEYEMGDSGAIHLEISVPSIGATFGNRNFYSRKEGQKDTLNTDKISDDGQELLERINAISGKVNDKRLDQAREKAQNAANIGSSFCSSEEIMGASNDLLESKKLVYEVRKDNLSQIRQSELDSCVAFFNESVRRYAKPTEADAFDNQAQAAQRAIDRNDPDFENLLNELRGKNFGILWRQDWFVIDWFKRMVSMPYNFADQDKYLALKKRGESCIVNDRIEDLRQVIYDLWDIEINEASIADMMEKANIVRG
jgi:molecular chaperone DnaK